MMAATTHDPSGRSRWRLSTIALLVALIAAWSELAVRGWLLVGLSSYTVMRVWSGIYFIPEMLRFQKVPLDSAPSRELSDRVARWTFWTWFREPLDVISFVSAGAPATSRGWPG